MRSSEPLDFHRQLVICSVYRVAQEAKKAEESQNAATEALQKSAALQGQVDALEKALQKAEERTAKLEYQAILSVSIMFLVPPHVHAACSREAVKHSLCRSHII